MSEKKSVDITNSHRIINHGPTVLVTAFDVEKNRPTAMTCAWSMPIGKNPPRLAVLVGMSSYTRKCFEKTKEFCVNVPSAAQKDLTISLGHGHGDQVEKLAGVKMQQCEKISGNLIIEDCIGHLECKLVEMCEVAGGPAKITIGEVVKAISDEKVFFDGSYHLDASDPAKTTLHHAGGPTFFKACV